MKSYTVTPAYGRDYNTSDRALSDWEDGRDFILETIDGAPSRWSGKPINKEALEPGDTVRIRYNRLRRVIVQTSCTHPHLSYHADRAECQECGDILPLPTMIDRPYSAGL